MRKIQLTVYFEAPFWVAVFERWEEKQLSACKVTFGAEPKDYELWAFILQNYNRLKFSPALKAPQKKSADNPKRRQRNARKQMQNCGVGTKSQQALAALQEEKKAEQKQKNRIRKETEKQQRFEQRQQKRKEKHRGH